MKNILFVTILLLPIVQSFAGDIEPPFISVQGTALTQVTPDRLIWSLTLKNEGPDLAEVAKKHIELSVELDKAIEASGIAKKDVSTSKMEFGENYVYRNSSQIKEGYLAKTSVTFKTNDFSKYQSTWLNLAAIKEVSLTSIMYDHSKRIDFQNETRKSLIEVFKKMAKLNRKYKAQKVIALATSAMRDAKNSRSIISEIKKITKIQVTTITGQTEAELIRLSIFKSQIINFKTALLIDIGGGSAEFSTMKNEKIISSQSFPLGVVRLLNLTQKRNKSVAEIAKPILKKIKLKNKTQNIQIAIGTGGNFDALSKLKLQLLKKSPNTNLTKTEIEQILKIWNQLSLVEKEALNIRRDRIDVLPLAIELILETLKLFHIEKVKIPLTGLKEGAIYSALS